MNGYTRRRTFATLTLAVALSAAACGKDQSAPGSGDASAPGAA